MNNQKMKLRNKYQNSIKKNNIFWGLPWWSSVGVCLPKGRGFQPSCRKIPQAAGQLSPQDTTKQATAMRSPQLYTANKVPVQPQIHRKNF